MIRKLLCKCFTTLCLLLLTAFLLPVFSINVATAKAGVVGKEKNEEYRLNLKSITLVKSKSYQLKVYNLGDNAKVSFKSSDSEIASVNDDGVVLANKVGTTTITVTIKDGNGQTPLTCDVTVGPPAFSVKFTKSRIIMGLGTTDFFNVILKPSNTAEVAKFSSYDSSIVNVSPGGRITANKLGLTYLFAEIDAKNADGSPKFAVCSVIVTNPEDTASFENYFNSHPELDMISEGELTNALDAFFNGKTDDVTNSKVEDVSKSEAVNKLNRYLEAKFDLATLRAKREAATANSK